MYTNTMKALAIFTMCAAAQATPWLAEPRSGYWLDKHESFKKNTLANRDNISVIFYGDSIVEGWSSIGKDIFDAKYAPLGDKTENLLYRISGGEVYKLTPKLVVLKIGTNNLGSNSNDEIVRGIQAVVDLLLKSIPSSRLLLLGILPRTDAKMFTRVVDINIKISKLHDGNRIHFLDMFNEFATEWGVVDSSSFNRDKLHLEAAGYQNWADTMDHIFNKLYQSSLLQDDL